MPDILDKVKVKLGDSFFIPTGRIHALGAGAVIAEVQQASDITYRIFDYNRVEDSGMMRELHTEKAFDVIDFRVNRSYNNQAHLLDDDRVNLARCKYFTTNLLTIKDVKIFDKSELDRFTILICVEGRGLIAYGDKEDAILLGETLLLPASLLNFSLKSLSVTFKIL